MSHSLVEPNKILLPPLHIKLGVMKNFVNAIDREGSGSAFFPGEVSLDKHGEAQSWYIWQPSNKRTHEGPNVWRSIKQSWTVCLAVVTNFLRKPLKCRIQEGDWRATEEFPLTQGSNVNQTALSAVTPGQFSKKLWRFEWRSRCELIPRHLKLWKSAIMASGI